MTTSSVTNADVFADARQVADAVLFEGYVLYPYRASSAKNQLRWQFGVLVPVGYGTDSGERSHFSTAVLVDPGDRCELDVEIRFLQVQSRTVETAKGDDSYAPVDQLAVSDAVHVPWDEGVERSFRTRVPLPDPGGFPVTVDFVFDAGIDTEVVVDGSAAVGRFVRERWPLTGRLVVGVQEIEGPYRTVEVDIRVENTTAADLSATRDIALRTSLVAAHALVAVDDGRFVSPTDPPEWAKPYTDRLTNVGAWPVLVGPGDDSDVVLCTPIILEDHPQIAAESSVQLYDGTEIDEILTLRTMALTEQEKREARGTDPRAAAVIDQVDALPPEMLDRLHGAIRALTAKPTIGSGLEAERPELPPWWDPAADASVAPESDTVVIDGKTVARGSKVVLQPGRHRRGDAQDLFLVGRDATVHAVVTDVDDQTYLAVTVDDDPGAELSLAQGRFRYFRPDEVEVR